MSTPFADRERVLRSLLELERPLDEVVRELSALRWDSEEEVLTLRPQHLIEVLRRFKSGALSAAEVESWANAVEGREDIGFEDATHQVVKAALFDLANPELQGVLSADLANQWMERLREAVGEAGRTNGA